MKPNNNSKKATKETGVTFQNHLKFEPVAKRELELGQVDFVQAVEHVTCQLSHCDRVLDFLRAALLLGPHYHILDCPFIDTLDKSDSSVGFRSLDGLSGGSTRGGALVRLGFSNRGSEGGSGGGARGSLCQP